MGRSEGSGQRSNMNLISFQTQEISPLSRLAEDAVKHKDKMPKKIFAMLSASY